MVGASLGRKERHLAWSSRPTSGMSCSPCASSFLTEANNPDRIGWRPQTHGAASAAVYELLRGVVALHARLAGLLGQLRSGGFLQCSLASLVAVRCRGAIRITPLGPIHAPEASCSAASSAWWRYTVCLSWSHCCTVGWSGPVIVACSVQP